MKKISGSFVSATLSLFVFIILFSATPAFAALSAVSVQSGSQIPNPVTAGSSATFTANVTNSNGSTGRVVSITSVSGLPSGATLGSSSCVVIPGDGVSHTITFTINTTGATAAGTTNFGITATRWNNTSTPCSGGVSDTMNSSASSGSLVVGAAFPTVSSINRAGATPTSASSVSWTVVFSQSVSGVDATDFAIANTGVGGSPALTGVSGSGTTYTVTASTGSGSGTLGLNLVDDDTVVATVGGAKLGGAGLANGNFTGQTYAIDRTGPTLAQVTAVPTYVGLVNGGSNPKYTLSSTEAVTTLTYGGDCGAFGGIGGTASLAGSGNTQITLPTLAEGLHSNCTVTGTDSFGNVGNTLAINSFTIDITQPSGQTISYPNTSIVGPVSVTYGIGVDNVGGTGLDNASAKLQRASATGSCTSYSAFASVVTGAAATTGSYTDSSVTNGSCYKYQYVISDLAGNTSTTTSSNVVKIDTTAPAFSSIAPANNASINSITTPSDVSYTLSEALASGSITMTQTSGTADPASPHICTLKGTALNSGSHAAFDMSNTTNSCTNAQSLVSGAVYSFTFAGTDLAGNTATQVTTTNVNFDNTQPSVTIEQAAAQADPTNGSTINFTVVFSKSVTGFSGADVQLSGTEPGARAANVTGSGTTYNVAVTGMTAVGTVIASVNAGAATDANGNSSLASTALDNTVTFDNGYHQPGSGAIVSNSTGSITPNNAFSSDNNYTTFDTTSDIVEYTNFNLPSIPAGATIDGIEVVFEGNRSSNSNPRMADVLLSWNGGTNSVTKLLSFSSTGDASVALGGAADTWGHAWTATELLNANFKMTVDASLATGNLNIDQIRVKVHFTPDTSAPTLAIVTPIPANTNDSTPNLTFSSSEVGSINYSGDCSSVTLLAASGSNTITLNTLSDAMHSNCALTVTDIAGNTSAPLAIAAFTVDTLLPVTTIGTATDGNAQIVADTATTKSSSISITFTANGTGTSIANSSCVLDGGTPQNCTSPVVYSSLADGAHTLDISSTDAAGNVEHTAHFTWTVDTTAPVVTVPSAITSEATSASGASVSFSSSANDAHDGPITPSCSPVSGSTFEIGETLVTCTASDAVGNSGSTSFHVTVSDTVAPVLHDTPANMTVEATSASGATVDYTAPTATDDVDTTPDVSCSPASGSTFALGPILVTCTATDDATNSAQSTFTVTVEDTTGPDITTPTDIAGVEATSNAGAIVTYTEATATDAVDGTDSVSCDKNSGDTFALGTTVVHCSATDTATNTSSKNFSVTVVDTTSPAVTVPSDITVEAVGVTTPVNFTVSASDVYAGSITPTCDANSGDAFSVGTTLVSCSASDGNGNTGNASFNIIVTDLTAPEITVLGNNPETVEGGSVYADAGATASDAVDGNLTSAIVTVNPVNTAIVSDYTVTYDVVDSHGNHAAQKSRLVHVVDTTAPVIVGTPADISTEATGATTVVTWASPTATDNVDGTSDVVTCAPDSGSAFAVGEHTITCSTQDAQGNPATPTTFKITIRDTTGPTIDSHEDVTKEATGASTDVDYTTPAAHDLVDGDLETVCSPVSGTSFAVGTHPVSCSVTDSNGNTSNSAFNIIVSDETKPEITMLGTTPETVEVHGTYTDAGATASDIVDGDLTATIVTNSDVDTNTVGTYHVAYDVTDLAGNSATQVVRTVHVVDTTIPTISLNGDAEVTIQVHTPYSDLGAVAHDNNDADANITTPDTVNSDVVGNYTLTYNHTDSAGNAALQVTRVVHVVDTTKPVITLLGDEPQVVQVHDAYVEAGATVSDNYDLSISPVIDASAVNTNLVGGYVVTYNAVDSNDNHAEQVTRHVQVKDTAIPTIELNGAAEIPIEVHAAYSDLGAVAHDNYDTDANVSTPDTVNVDVVGDYSLHYNHTDSNGNVALEVTRVVHVKDTTPPTISINGDADVTLEVGASYSDLGAVAHDNYDADTAVSATGSVDTNTVGNYTLHYNFTDSNGNLAVEVTRVVHIIDTTAPVITLTGDDPQIIEVHGSYAELGATVSDNYDTGLIVLIDISALNLDVVGEYIVKYDTQDSNGNHAVQKTRVVKVVDTTVPVINLNGNNPETVELGSLYVDAGATATDNYDSSAPVAATGAVDGNTVGEYILHYNFTDANNNTATEVTRTVNVVDTTAPVVTINPLGTTGPNGTIDFSVHGGSALECILDTNPATDCTSSTTPITSFAYAGLSEGTHLFKVTAIDPSSNVGSSTMSWTVDATGPLVSIESPIDGSVNGSQNHFAYTVSGATSFECRIDSVLVGIECDSDGFNRAFTSGQHSFSVTATDAYGNQTTASVSFTADNAGPDVEITSGPAAGSTITTDSGSFAFTSSDAVSYQCALDSSPQPCTSPFIFSGLSESFEHLFLVRGIDSFGNIGAPTQRLFTVSIPAPVITDESAGSFDTTTATITWTTDHPATSRVVYDTVSHNPVTDPAPNYGYAFSTGEDANPTVSHSVIVTGLTSGTTYFFRPVSHGSPEAYGVEVSGSTLPGASTTGTLTVQKVVVGGTKVAADFSFQIDGGIAQIFEADGTNELSVSVGSHTINEVNPNTAGYATSYGGDCNALGDVSVGQNENKICVITNTYGVEPPPQKGNLKVVKLAQGGSLFQNFSFSGDAGNFSIFTFFGYGSKTIKNLDAGTYSVTENPKSGWHVAENSCTNVQVTAGNTTTCVIKNVKDAPTEGKLKVVKISHGGNGRFSFELSDEGEDTAAFSIRTSHGKGSKTISHLEPGTYSVSENPKAGWSTESNTCVDVEVTAGETSTCTIVNTRDSGDDDDNNTPETGTIVVEKHTNPSGDTTNFSFVASYDADGFVLADSNTNVTENLAAGSYTVAESATEGWNSNGGVCTSSVASKEQSASAISLEAGETVTCVFTNTKVPEATGTIVIKKVTNPLNDTTDFNFTASYDADGFVLADGESNVAAGLSAGVYAVSETLPTGWTQTSAVCDDSSNPGSIALAPGETVTCTFTNTKNASENNSGGGSQGGSGSSGGSSGGGNGPIVGSFGGGSAQGGQVLGASTSLPELPADCTALLNSYMRLGRKNDSEEVKKLQQFLNQYLGANLPVTGFFGSRTNQAVKKFQKAYEPEILRPWGITDPTGYVYKTTQRWINLTQCKTLTIPMPELF